MNVLILGAKSDISVALSKSLAREGHHLWLAARDVEFLDSLKSDLQIRYGILVDVIQFDATDFTNHQNWFQSLETLPDVVVTVFGYLGEQQVAETSWDEAQKILNVNFVGAVSILNVVASAFVMAKRGIIVGVSSVAGDRGRQSNYIYGSAKAGLSAYLSGLRNRMWHAGVHVVTVKPGFVATKMTEGLDLPPALTASPEQVAELIAEAIKTKKNIVYARGMWRWIMMIIRLIPESMFKRLRL